MRLWKIAFSCVALGSFFAVGLMAEPTTNPTTAPSTQPAAPVNKYCAVMSDHEVDEEVTVVHKGTTIGFCCEDCIPKFKKNPDKYIKNLK
jgi:YHS domain-containing protein